MGLTLNQLENLLNDLYEDWFDTLRAEITEGGSLPKDERSAAHLTHGLDAISRKIDEVRAELDAIEAARLGQS